MEKEPTYKQLRFIRDLATARGVPEPTVKTRRGAAAAIDLLKARPIVPWKTFRPNDSPTDRQIHDIAVLARRLGIDPPTPLDRGAAATEHIRLSARARRQESAIN